MKIVNTILFVLMMNFACGQKGNNTNIDANDLQRWEREDFIKNELNIISAYSYEIDKNGNIQKDSLLLYRKQFDASENKVFGIECGTTRTSHGESYLEWNNFETYYNNNGQIIKNRIMPNIKEEDSKFSIEYTIGIAEMDYEYDSLNREIKRVNTSISSRYIISKQTKDTTFYFHSISNPRIDVWGTKQTILKNIYKTI